MDNLIIVILSITCVINTWHIVKIRNWQQHRQEGISQAVMTLVYTLNLDDRTEHYFKELLHR